MHPIPKKYILFVVAFFPWLSFSQEAVSKMDSLEFAFENADSESARAYLLCDMAKIAYGLDSTEAFAYPKRAISIFKKEKDSFGLGRAYSVLGGVHFDYGRMQNAEENLRKAKSIFEGLMQRDTLAEGFPASASNCHSFPNKLPHRQ